MPNKDIFCNTPWYELHIYWDGSLGICCQETHKLYQEGNGQYNIATMTIADWFNSDPVKNFRERISGNKPLSECQSCYFEEQHNAVSRRNRSNQKSVIFTRAFDQSFQQSPGYSHFKLSEQHHGITDTHPIDMHIDLGNYCNLACKMCNAEASSTIASQQVKWGIVDSRKFLGTDWTRDQQVWKNFKQQLLDIPNLNNIHLMGGETLLTNRFEDLVDTMIEHRRFDVCFSFVTNGTVFNEQLLDKLKLFRRVGIEISIETIDEHNAYQRQGTDTELVLNNLARYQQWCNGSSITVSVRPAPSALTIGYYDTLLEYCLKNQLIVKANLCYSPRFLYAEILPTDVKQLYAQRYQSLLSKLNQLATNSDYNASDPNNYAYSIKVQAEMCLNILQTSTPNDSEQQLELMVRHCEKWDQEYGLDARQLYPEFFNLLKKYEYQV
jgi:pyruvate-formate lyase-activating enzyme